MFACVGSLRSSSENSSLFCFVLFFPWWGLTTPQTRTPAYYLDEVLRKRLFWRIRRKQPFSTARDQAAMSAIEFRDKEKYFREFCCSKTKASIWCMLHTHPQKLELPDLRLLICRVYAAQICEQEPSGDGEITNFPCLVRHGFLILFCGSCHIIGHDKQISCCELKVALGAAFLNQFEKKPKWPKNGRLPVSLWANRQKTFWCAYYRHAICLPSFLLPSETGWVGWILKHFWEPDSKKMRLKQSLGSKMWLFRKDIFRLFFCGSTHDRQAEHISCCSVKLISEPGFLIRILEGTAEPKWPIWPKIAFYVFSGMPFGDFFFFCWFAYSW